MTASVSAPPADLPLGHKLLALGIVAIWGTNFAVMKIGLGHFPPLVFALLRFFFCAFPAMLFIKPPPVRWAWLALYGLLLGVGQFALIYVAVSQYIAPGLASLIVQLQVFFTILMCACLGERIGGAQWIALAVAFCGLAVIALHVDAETTVLGLVLMLIAAVCWAGGNMVIRGGGRVDMLAYVVWASLFSVPVLLVLSLWLEGAAAMRRSVASAGWADWAAVLWQSTGNTLFGFAAWGWLLNRYRAADVTPYALLVPIFGLGATVIWLHEPLPLWKIAATALVVGGLALNTGASRYAARRAAMAIAGD